MKEELKQLIQDSKAFLLKKSSPSLLPKPKAIKKAAKPFIKPSFIPSKPNFVPSPSEEKPQKTSLIQEKPPVKTAENPPLKKASSSKNARAFPEIHTPSQKSPPRFATQTMAQFLQKFSPTSFISTPPDDALAKRIKTKWERSSSLPQIVILKFSQEYQNLLENLATAIDLQLKSSRVIHAKDWANEQEVEDILSSGQIELIISSDHLLTQPNSIKAFYKELPVEKKRFLGKVPLLLLPDLSLYYSDPMLKRSLWNLICRLLNKPPVSPKSS